VVVWGAPASRASLTSIQNLTIDTPDGRHVHLKDVASVRLKPNVGVVRHDAVSRRIDVAANVQGRSVDEVVKDVKDKLKGVSFPIEYHAEVIGGYADRARLLYQAWGLGTAAVVVIFLLLQTAFGSWRLAAALLLTSPVAVAGGVFAALMSGAGVTLASLVGLFLVWGIAIRWGLVLVRHLQQRPDEGAGERAVPVLLTAVTVAVALVPVLFFGREAGSELLYPLAAVVLGGLVTAAAYALLAVPALNLLLGSRHTDAGPQSNNSRAEGSRRWCGGYVWERSGGGWLPCCWWR